MPPLSEVVLRDAAVDDADAVRELTLKAYGQYSDRMTPSAWTALLEAIRVALSTGGPAQQIVAERAGSMVGSVMLFPPYAEAYSASAPRAQWPEIRLLAVTPEARGLGVGKLLVNACIQRARAMGAQAIGLHTSSSMREAIRLYENLGFERDPTHDIRVEGAEHIDAYKLSVSR